MVSGNAALCLAHCLELKGIASNLLGTDIVLELLRHAAGDAKRTAVQQNAAVALGKLCQSEPRCALTSLAKHVLVYYRIESGLQQLYMTRSQLDNGFPKFLSQNLSSKCNSSPAHLFTNRHHGLT